MCRSTVECATVHTGVLQLLSAVGLPGSKMQDRQANIELKHFSSSVFRLAAVSELTQAVLYSVHFFSTLLPCPFEVTQCSTLLSLKIMGRTHSLLPLWLRLPKGSGQVSEQSLVVFAKPSVCAAMWPAGSRTPFFHLILLTYLYLINLTDF